MTTDAYDRTLTLLVYGDTKVGKTQFSATAPAPRLFFDVEHGTKFLDIKRKVWDPKTDPPPENDGTWDTVIVPTLDYDTVLKGYDWLRSGQHPFKSVIIDSVSELQAKVVESTAGTRQLKIQDWGEVLRHMASFMRDLRDLTAQPVNPLQCVILTAMARESDGRKIPYLQGQAATIAPYIYDITGYISVEEFAHPDPTQLPFKARRMYVVGTPKFMAGERVGGRLGEIVEQDMMNIPSMLDTIYGPLDTTTE